jgi:acyl-coenzyme A thioesterase PaaI-like protein
MINDIQKYIENILKIKYENIEGSISLPPPVFTSMDAIILEYDELRLFIKIKIPLNKTYSNPFGKMQGGMIAAAIDNAFGPLSMLTSQLNFTRNFEIKYKRQIDVSNEYIIVEANVIDQESNKLHMIAKVFDHDGCVMATAKATNYIV